MWKSENGDKNNQEQTNASDDGVENAVELDRIASG
jgi:hypothetical protein